MRVLLNGKGAILFAVGNVTSALVGVNPGFDNWCSPCNRCVRFATTVASGHATLATKRALLRTWAGTCTSWIVASFAWRLPPIQSPRRRARVPWVFEAERIGNLIGRTLPSADQPFILT